MSLPDMDCSHGLVGQSPQIRQIRCLIQKVSRSNSPVLLLGHTRGAFTGAMDAKKGLIDIADGGTAFFDEIGDLPLEMQVKLLRLLQEQEFRPVGSLQTKKVEMRVIAATHRNLEQRVA